MRNWAPPSIWPFFAAENVDAAGHSSCENHYFGDPRHGKTGDPLATPALRRSLSGGHSTRIISIYIYRLRCFLPLTDRRRRGLCKICHPGDEQSRGLTEGGRTRRDPLFVIFPKLACNWTCALFLPSGNPVARRFRRKHLSSAATGGHACGVPADPWAQGPPFPPWIIFLLRASLLGGGAGGGRGRSKLKNCLALHRAWRRRTSKPYSTNLASIDRPSRTRRRLPPWPSRRLHPARVSRRRPLPPPPPSPPPALPPLPPLLRRGGRSRLGRTFSPARRPLAGAPPPPASRGFSPWRRPPRTAKMAPFGSSSTHKRSILLWRVIFLYFYKPSFIWRRGRLKYEQFPSF